MGIARRKAGTVVCCPKCGGQVIVPDPDDSVEAPARNPNPAQVFEHSNFGEVLQDPGNNVGSPIPPPPPPAKAGFDPATEFDPFAADQQTSSGGVTLSWGRMLLLLAVLFLLFGLVFFAGVLVGTKMAQPADPATEIVPAEENNEE